MLFTLDVEDGWMDLEAAGQWNTRMSLRSYSCRALMAILLTVKAFLPEVIRKSVQIQTNNIAAAAYLINQGGPSAELTKIAKAIWALVLHSKMYIQVRHVSEVSN